MGSINKISVQNFYVHQRLVPHGHFYAFSIITVPSPALTATELNLFGWSGSELGISLRCDFLLIGLRPLDLDD